MKGLKKLLALLLALLMIITVSPTTIFAEEPGAQDETETQPAEGGDEDPEPAETAEAAWFTSFGLKRGEGTLAQAAQEVTVSGKISVLKDIEELNETIEITKNITLEGNGHTVTRSKGFTDVMISVTDSAQVKISNITINGNSANIKFGTKSIINISTGAVILNDGAKLTSNNAAASGGAVTVGSNSVTGTKSLTLEAGSEISDCSASYGGGVVVNSSSVLNLDGGIIKGCSASIAGGAVYMSDAGAALRMTAGEITECKATSHVDARGSAILIAQGASAVITGGKIYNNVIENGLGAVYVAVPSKFTIGSNAYIYDNKTADGADSNVYLAANAKAVISPDFRANAKIGLMKEGGFTNGEPFDTFLTFEYGTEIMGYIFSDADGKTFCVNEDDGTLDLRQAITVTFDPGNGTCPVKSKVYAVGLKFDYLPDPDERKDFEFLGWYTKDDVQITEKMTVEFDGDVTLTAKWKNLYETDNSPFAVIGRFFQRIGDLMRMVFDFLEGLFTGSGDKDLGNMFG